VRAPQPSAGREPTRRRQARTRVQGRSIGKA
jgi:hypothetical protein